MTMHIRKAREATQERDQAILRYIYDFQTLHQYPPVLMDIGGRFGMTRSMVFEAVVRLQEQGLVIRGKRQSSRAMAITPAGLTRLGLTEEARAAGVHLVPVLHSTEALRQWLATPTYRQRVPAVRALAGQTVDLQGLNQ